MASKSVGLDAQCREKLLRLVSIRLMECGVCMQHHADGQLTAVENSAFVADGGLAWRSLDNSLSSVKTFTSAAKLPSVGGLCQHTDVLYLHVINTSADRPAEVEAGTRPGSAAEFGLDRPSSRQIDPVGLSLVCLPRLSKHLTTGQTSHAHQPHLCFVSSLMRDCRTDRKEICPWICPIRLPARRHFTKIRRTLYKHGVLSVLACTAVTN